MLKDAAYQGYWDDDDTEEEVGTPRRWRHWKSGSKALVYLAMLLIVVSWARPRVLHDSTHETFNAPASRQGRGISTNLQGKLEGRMNNFFPFPCLVLPHDARRLPPSHYTEAQPSSSSSASSSASYSGISIDVLFYPSEIFDDINLLGG